MDNAVESQSSNLSSIPGWPISFFFLENGFKFMIVKYKIAKYFHNRCRQNITCLIITITDKHNPTMDPIEDKAW